MTSETLAFLRDLALLLLCLEFFVLMLVPAVILYFVWKYTRKVRPALRAPLLRAQVLALRAEHTTLRASNAVAGVPITLNALGARWKGTARALIGRGARGGRLAGPRPAARGKM